ncbi:MAG: hypothetical protein IH989_03390 [Planctomycetes bacterium]|nr:hypothetical protein [Planctomycetota bacterium]
MPEVRLDNHSIQAVAARVSELLVEKFSPLARLVEQTAENIALPALRYKELLTLKDAARLLETCDATLRKKRLLNDLEKRTYEPTKLNGFRLSKAPNAQWRFHLNEVRRFALALCGPIIASDGEAAEMRAGS